MLKFLYAIVLVFIISSCVKDSASTSQKAFSFEWDFSEPKTYVYTYEQTSTGTNKRYKDRPAEKMDMTGVGKLIVQVKENSLADLSLAEVAMTMQLYNEDGSKGGTRTAVMPTKVVKDMTANSNSSDDSEMLFHILMPLPKTNIKKGEIEQIPLKMPFNPHGSVLFSRGFNTLKFVGFESVDGRNCAVLKGFIDISEIDQSDDLVGENVCSTVGSATYYFDLEKQFYVGADIQFTMEVVMDAQNSIPEEMETYMRMKNDNVYKIRLKEIL